jgi:AcrR family transcriptional regulator
MKRRYEQVARARRAEETGHRILRAGLDLYAEKGYADLTLHAVAERAGVTKQTVIRRFGDKEGLVAACGEVAVAQIRDQRDEAPPADLPAAVGVLIAHYEEFGDSALRLLADEHLSPQIARYAENGRRYHREWCARVFAPHLEGLTPAVRRRRLAQFVAICDVYTWKLLRLQEALPASQVRAAITEMLIPLAGGAEP